MDPLQTEVGGDESIMSHWQTNYRAVIADAGDHACACRSQRWESRRLTQA